MSEDAAPITEAAPVASAPTTSAPAAVSSPGQSGEAGHVSQSTETVTAPTSEATAPTTAVSEAPQVEEAAPTEPTEPAFSFDGFDWDGWDGEVSSFPENFQTPLTQAYGRGKSTTTGDWESKVKSMNEDLTTSREEIETLRAVYDALAMGKEDPRLQDLTTERDNLQSQLQEAQGKYDTYHKHIEESSKAEAQSWAVDFRAQHPEIFEDKSKTAEYQKIIQEEGWDFNPGVEFMNLSPKAQEAAREAKSNGASDAFAIKFAKSTASAHPPPRAGANITHGATRVSQGESVQDPQVKMGDVSDLTRWAARRALARSSRR